MYVKPNVIYLKRLLETQVPEHKEPIDTYCELNKKRYIVYHIHVSMHELFSIDIGYEANLFFVCFLTKKKK